MNYTNSQYLHMYLHENVVWFKCSSGSSWNDVEAHERLGTLSVLIFFTLELQFLPMLEHGCKVIRTQQNLNKGFYHQVSPYHHPRLLLKVNVVCMLSICSGQIFQAPHLPSEQFSNITLLLSKSKGTDEVCGVEGFPHRTWAAAAWRPLEPASVGGVGLHRGLRPRAALQ